MRRKTVENGDDKFTQHSLNSASKSNATEKNMTGEQLTHSFLDDGFEQFKRE